MFCVCVFCLYLSYFTASNYLSFSLHASCVYVWYMFIKRDLIWSDLHSSTGRHAHNGIQCTMQQSRNCLASLAVVKLSPHSCPVSTSRQCMKQSDGCTSNVPINERHHQTRCVLLLLYSHCTRCWFSRNSKLRAVISTVNLKLSVEITARIFLCFVLAKSRKMCTRKMCTRKVKLNYFPTHNENCNSQKHFST